MAIMRRAQAVGAAATAPAPVGKRRSSGIRHAKQDRLFYVLNVGFLGLTFLVVVYPLIYVLSSSFSDALEVVAGRVWLYPVKPSLEGLQGGIRVQRAMARLRQHPFLYGVPGPSTTW